MKILLTSHGFPPHANAGAETHAAELARRLVLRGHEVHVLAALKDIAREHLSLRERLHGDVHVHELVNNLFHERFVETYDHPVVDGLFEGLLERLAPDVVHVQHLLYLSGGIVARARARSIPVLMTLHDYWLQCPRFGQRLHADGGLCASVDFERCGTCLTSLPWAQGGLERTIGPWIARVKSSSGVDLGPLARGAARVLAPKDRDRASEARGGALGHDHSASGATPSARATGLAREARVRTEWLLEHVVPLVERFVSPSRFLRQRFIEEWGIPAEHIEHVPFGIDEGIAQRVRPRRAERDDLQPLRVAFFGALAPHKGPHFLLEAWARLAPETRARGQLVLFGAPRGDAAYQARLSELARGVGATLGGELDRTGVEGELARADLVVVPSLWYENSPLVILEAIAARTPLLVADQGGMAELVEEGVTGFHFLFGDAQDLARQLTRAIEGSLGLDRLAGRGRALPGFDDHVARVAELYAKSVTAAHGRSRADS